MKKLWLLFTGALLISNLTFANPIMPESLISEVYFDDDDNWYLVVDVFFMEILGIQSFQEIDMYSSSGAFVFKDDFLPDFSTYQTIITEDALVYPHQMFRESDHISAWWPDGWFDFMYLEWGNSWGDPVKGPFYGQSLIPVMVYEDEFFNPEFWLVKCSSPWFLGNGGMVTGEFEGFLFDQNEMPVANAQIKYVPDWMTDPPYFFPPLITDQSGYFYDNSLYACNYHLHRVIIDGFEYDFDEYVSIEPDSVNTYFFQIVTTEVDDRNLINKTNIYNYPNPFSDFTTFFVQNLINYEIGTPELKITNLMGQVVSEHEVTIVNVDNSFARFCWKNQLCLPPGIYCYQLMIDEFSVATGKMTIQ